MFRLWLFLFCSQFHYKIWELSCGDRESHPLLPLDEKKNGIAKANCNRDWATPLDGHTHPSQFLFQKFIVIWCIQMSCLCIYLCIIWVVPGAQKGQKRTLVVSCRMGAGNQAHVLFKKAVSALKPWTLCPALAELYCCRFIYTAHTVPAGENRNWT